MNYSQKIVSALSWTSVLRGFFRATVFVKIAILARILSPSQFGLFGITTIALSFLEIVTETGINPFLIQEDKVDPYIDSAWVISIFRGVVISAAIFSFARPVSLFFNSSASFHLLQLSAFIPLIRGFINPSCVRLIKDLRFNHEFFYRSGILFLETLMAIILAVWLRTPVALVLAMIISAIWEVVASFIFISPRPKFHPDPKKCLFILSRGKWVTGFGILEFLFTNIDNIVVGRLLGSASLGLYQNAYKISTVPLVELNDIVYKSSFPLFSHMQASSYPKLKSTVLKIASASTLLMLILGLVLFTFSKEVVLFLLGPAWLEIIPTVKILAFLGVIKGISYSFNAVFMAKKKQNLVTLITLTSVMGLSISIIPLVARFGIQGAGLAALIGSLATLPLSLYFIAKEIKSS